MPHRIPLLPCAHAGLLLAAGLVACPAVAAQPAQTSAAGWRLQITPYVWTLGLKSSLQLAPAMPTAQVTQSFSDVFKDLKAAAFVHATARHTRYVLQADASYASLARQATLGPGVPVRAKLQQSAFTLLGGYPWTLSERNHLDLMAGLRAWHVRAQVQARPLLDTRLGRSFVDPIVAVRWRHVLNESWSSLAYADAGGWNVGSKRTWQMLVTLNYQWKEQLYFSAGYRRLYVDYRDGPQRIAAHMAGPVLGATWRF